MRLVVALGACVLGGCSLLFQLSEVPEPPAGCGSSSPDLMCADFEQGQAGFFTHGTMLGVPAAADGASGTLVNPGANNTRTALQIATTSGDYKVEVTSAAVATSIEAHASFDLSQLATQDHDLTLLYLALDGAQTLSCYAFVRVPATTHQVELGHHCDDTNPNGGFATVLPAAPVGFATLEMKLDLAAHQVSVQVGSGDPVTLSVAPVFEPGRPDAWIGFEGTIPKTATMTVDEVRIDVP